MQSQRDDPHGAESGPGALGRLRELLKDATIRVVRQEKRVARLLVVFGPSDAGDEAKAILADMVVSRNLLAVQLEALQISRARGPISPQSSNLDLPFRVHYLRAGSNERKVAGRFGRYIEAEVFIHSELLKCASFGTDSGRFWGSGPNGHYIHLWIESPQLTASARECDDVALPDSYDADTFSDIDSTSGLIVWQDGTPPTTKFATVTTETKIDPPIVVRGSGDNALALDSVEQLIEYVRNHDNVVGWSDLRDAAFVAAAMPSPVTIAALRRIADEKLR